jgi:hypothetical protein
VSSKVNAWNTGLTADLAITNTGTTAVNGWSLTFTLAAGQSITAGWNATYSPASGQVAARNAGYNGTIAAGASVSIGFQAGHTGTTAGPTAFALDGVPCVTSCKPFASGAAYFRSCRIDRDSSSVRSAAVSFSGPKPQ